MARVLSVWSASGVLLLDEERPQIAPVMGSRDSNTGTGFLIRNVEKIGACDAQDQNSLHCVGTVTPHSRGLLLKLATGILFRSGGGT